ncbi:MAG: hypothetical protein ACI9YH_002399 [Colwellia sp.]
MNLSFELDDKTVKVSIEYNDIIDLYEKLLNILINSKHTSYFEGQITDDCFRSSVF